MDSKAPKPLPRTFMRELGVPIAMQAIFLCLGSTILDGGRIFTVLVATAGAYWVGVALIAIRLRGRPPEGRDRELVRWGFMLALGLAILITPMCLWVKSVLRW